MMHNNNNQPNYTSTPLPGSSSSDKETGVTEATVLRLEDVFKIYREGEIETVALRGVTLNITRGEFVAIVGRSGSGKSTLLTLAAGLTTPSAGKVWVEGQDVARLSEGARANLRRRRLGIVFQNNNLVPFLSALENVELTIERDAGEAGNVTKLPKSQVRQQAKDLLEQVGLGERLHHRPAQLSGGEQQRVAIALALANNPLLLLADEPTGELDTTNATAIVHLLADLNRKQGVTIVLVTHNLELAVQTERCLRMADGLLTPFVPAPLENTKVAANGIAKAEPNRTAGFNSNPTLLKATHLVKNYPNQVVVVRDVSLEVRAGESVALMGPSGCGKSSLLNLLGGLDLPTSGSVQLEDIVLSSQDNVGMALLRRRAIGFVFQSHNLIATLSALENVALPLVLDEVNSVEWQVRAAELLQLVGLVGVADKTPDQLSGGQRQRVAIARSLAHRPRLLLADEPTGSLDSDTADQIMRLLRNIAHTQQLGLLIVTHDPVVAAYCDRTIYMRDGQIASAAEADPRLDYAQVQTYEEPI